MKATTITAIIITILGLFMTSLPLIMVGFGFLFHRATIGFAGGSKAIPTIAGLAAVAAAFFLIGINAAIFAAIGLVLASIIKQ